MTHPFAWSFRSQFLFGFLACAGLIAYALYVQYVDFKDPCPLCILQRVAFIALGIVFLIGALHGPRAPLGRRLYGALALFVAMLGAGVAGWHVHIQHLPPDQVPACGPGLEYMLEAFPLHQALAKVFAGSGECAEVNWTFLGLAMPAWALIWFLGLGAGAWYAGWRPRAPR